MSYFFEKHIRYHLLSCSACRREYDVNDATHPRPQMPTWAKVNLNKFLITLMQYRATIQHERYCKRCARFFAGISNVVLGGSRTTQEASSSIPCVWGTSRRSNDSWLSCPTFYLKFLLEEHMRKCEVCGFHFPNKLPPPGSAAIQPVRITAMTFGLFSSEDIYKAVDFLLYGAQPIPFLLNLTSAETFLYPTSFCLSSDELILLAIHFEERNLTQKQFAWETFNAAVHRSLTADDSHLSVQQRLFGEILEGRTTIIPHAVALDFRKFTLIRPFVLRWLTSHEESMFGYDANDYTEDFSLPPSWILTLATSELTQTLFVRNPLGITTRAAFDAILQRLVDALQIYGPTLQPPESGWYSSLLDPDPIINFLGESLERFQPSNFNLGHIRSRLHILFSDSKIFSGECQRSDIRRVFSSIFVNYANAMEKEATHLLHWEKMYGHHLIIVFFVIQFFPTFSQRESSISYIRCYIQTLYEACVYHQTMFIIAERHVDEAALRRVRIQLPIRHRVLRRILSPRQDAVASQSTAAPVANPSEPPVAGTSQSDEANPREESLPVCPTCGKVILSRRRSLRILNRNTRATVTPDAVCECGPSQQ